MVGTMQRVNELLYAIKAGKIWYLNLSVMLEVVSYLLYLRATTIHYDSSEKQKKDVTFAAKMLFASCTLIVVSIVTAIGLSKIVGIVIGAIGLGLMYYVEALPIWEEE